MSFLFEFVICFINAALMVYLYILFFSSFAAFRFNKKVTFVLALALILLFTSLLLFVKIPIVKFLIFILLTLLTSLLTNNNWYRALLLSGVAYALAVITEAFITFLLSSVLFISTQQATEGPFFIIGLLLSKALLFFLIVLIRRFVNKTPSQASWKKTLAILIIPASTIAVMVSQYNYFIKMQDYTAVDTVLTLLSLTFLLTSNFVVFELIDQIYRDTEKDQKLAVADKLINFQNENYKQLLQHNRDIQKIRHDYKNFLIGILSDLRKRNYENLQKDIENECNRLNLIAQSENELNIIDHIVAVKNNKAQEHQIRINYFSSNLSSIQISSIDLSIIIGNALDNAIEAVSKLENTLDKDISVLIKRHNNHIVIIIKNKVSENVDTNNMTTTKTDSLNHGFGLTEIKKLVEKYHGNVFITCEDKVFELRIILSNETNE